MFPEGQNGGANLASSTDSTKTPINIGWDPVVVDVLANYDGGKTMAGFGKVSGTIYGAWVIKMWGTKGTVPCGADSVITGYVTMAVGLKGDLATGTNCSLTSNAKVQWAWTNVPLTGIAVDTDRVSYVICSATEEYVFGGAAVAEPGVGDDAYIIVAGGSTRLSKEAYGLNSWTFQGWFIDYDGVTAAAAELTAGNGDDGAYKTGFINTALDLPFFSAVNDTQAILNPSFAANHCWTAVAARPDATDTKRVAIAGYLGSITTCAMHAIDGYSFWGVTLIAKLGKDWTNSTQFGTANAVFPVTELAGVND